MLKYVGNEKRLMKEDMVRHLGRFGLLHCHEKTKNISWIACML
jgi:hypothetical protein